MRFLSHILGGLVLRIVGTMAIAVIFSVFTTGLGKYDAGSTGVVGMTMSAIFFALGMFFLWPGAMDRLLQRRMSWEGRALSAIFWVLIVGLLLWVGRVSLIKLELLPQSFDIVISILAGSTLVLFIILYVAPGWAAADLARRERLRTAPPPPEPEEEWDDDEPEQPHYSGNWRERVAQRHADRSAALAEKQSGPAVSKLSYVTTTLLGLYIVFFFSGLYGQAEAQFLPTGALVAAAQTYRWWIVGAASALLGMLVVVAPMKNTTANQSGPAMRFVLGAGAGALFTGVFTVSAMTTGVPGLYTLIVKGTPGTERVTIADIGPRARRRGCDHVLYARAGGDLATGPRQICDVPSSIHDFAQAGETLVLTGHRSRWGFRYDNISR